MRKEADIRQVFTRRRKADPSAFIERSFFFSLYIYCIGTFLISEA